MFQHQDYKVTMIYAQPRLRNDGLPFTAVRIDTPRILVNWILIFVYSEKCSNNSQICEYKFEKNPGDLKG